MISTSLPGHLVQIEPHGHLDLSHYSIWLRDFGTILLGSGNPAEQVWDVKLGILGNIRVKDSAESVELEL